MLGGACGRCSAGMMSWDCPSSALRPGRFAPAAAKWMRGCVRCRYRAQKTTALAAFDSPGARN